MGYFLVAHAGSLVAAYGIFPWGKQEVCCSIWDLCCGMQGLLVAACEMFLVEECGIF